MYKLITHNSRTSKYLRSSCRVKKRQNEGLKNFDQFCLVSSIPTLTINDYWGLNAPPSCAAHFPSTLCLICFPQNAIGKPTHPKTIKIDASCIFMFPIPWFSIHGLMARLRTTENISVLPGSSVTTAAACLGKASVNQMVFTVAMLTKPKMLAPKAINIKLTWSLCSAARPYTIRLEALATTGRMNAGR